MTLSTSKRLGALALVAMFAFGACSSSGSSSEPSAAATTAASEAPAASEAAGESPSAPATASGSIIVSGSSTVEPISTAIAEAFKAANPDFNYTIDGPGTGDGFQRFCAGETDISDASRQIRAEGEADVCATNGIEYIELPVAYDGITIMTNPANAIECLSFADLYALTGPESTGFDTWAKAAGIAKELGSNTVFPEASLDITGPGEESGTFDSYVELVLAGIGEDLRKLTTDVTTRPDYVASANDNAIIEGITGSPSSLGWVGFAFAEENADTIKEIAVSEEPNGTCIAPTAETIADGSYPISRTLYIYVNKAKAAENPAVKAYVDYYLADGTISTALETVPYVNLPADGLAASQATWASSQ